MNLVLSATGTRADVLKYLSSVIGPWTGGTLIPVLSTEPKTPSSQSTAGDSAQAQIVSALAEYVKSAPENADQFTVQANIYVGWQV